MPSSTSFAFIFSKISGTQFCTMVSAVIGFVKKGIRWQKRDRAADYSMFCSVWHSFFYRRE